MLFKVYINNILYIPLTTSFIHYNFEIHVDTPN